MSNLVDVCTSPVSKEKRFNTEKTFQVQEYSKSSNDTGFIDQTNSTTNSSKLQIILFLIKYFFLLYLIHSKWLQYCNNNKKVKKKLYF